MSQHRYKITVAYDGSEFSGSQRQPDRRTVQQDIEEALAQLCGAPVRLHSSSRTDAGVHARGQVCHFDLAAVEGPQNTPVGADALPSIFLPCQLLYPVLNGHQLSCLRSNQQTFLMCCKTKP